MEVRLNELRALAKAPAVNWLADLEKHCAGVADALTAIHGEQYRIVVNHERGMVMVVQVRESA